MNNWKKDTCLECGRKNVWVKGGICFECVVTEIRVVIQLAIREEGLKAAQIQWENLKPQMKRDIEEGKKHDPQVEKLGNKFIETIEKDIYPNRSRNRWLIVGGIIVGVIILITFFYFVFKKKEGGESTS